MDEKKDIIKEYSNGEVTIVWKPAICIHAKNCWRELLEVFDPSKRPWINPHGASTERIIQQIGRCPSGALSYYKNDDKEKGKKSDPVKQSSEVFIEAVQGGPLMVSGSIAIKDKEGKTEHKCGTTAFCRCGQSKNQPYCDGSHEKSDFKN